MNPLLAPPVLLLRALDDLHTLATAVPAGLEAIVGLERRGGEIVALGQQVLELGARVEAAIEQLETRGGEIVEMGGHFEKLGDSMALEAHAVQQSAVDVVAAAREISAALPLLERAVALGEPLEGTVERIGRVVDRLPGGNRVGRGRIPSDSSGA